jgi:hypothetical protein
MIPDDYGGDHDIYRCRCFECFCAQQVRRVVKQVQVVDRPRRKRRAEALVAAHDEIVMFPHARMCLPNLDYYDNRRPRRKRQ